MSRSVAYRRTVSDICNWNQQQALNATIYILREIGPTGFLLQEDGDSKKYKVLIGDPHICTCSMFKKTQDLCKHICWVLLKKFRLKVDDSLSWQIGLVEREINSLLYQKPPNLPPASDVENQPDIQNTQEDSQKTEICQRPIMNGDICPICQDELLESRQPVTFCRETCGNNVHMRCMKVWTDHQRKQKQISLSDFVTCPFCRGNFACLSHLLKELSYNHSSKDASNQKESVVMHTGTECAHCHLSPIKGKLYKCQVCTHYLLCPKCFNLDNVHIDHDFNYREKSSSRWQLAPRIRSLPAVVSLQHREITNMDYDLLLQLDETGTGSDFRQSDLERLKSWRIRSNSYLLNPGHQCRICLMYYKTGELVRKTSPCSHVFHAACLDPWLLHRKPSCPLDGETVILPPVLNSCQNVLETEATNSHEKSESLRFKENITTLNVSGLGIYTSSDTRKPSENNAGDIINVLPLSIEKNNSRTLPPLTRNKMSQRRFSNINHRPMSTENFITLRSYGRGQPSERIEEGPAPGIEIQHTPASIPSNIQNKPNLSIGNGHNCSIENTYHHVPVQESCQSKRQRSKTLLRSSNLRSRSLSSSRRERKEREKSYAADARLQKAVKDLEIYATSHNIPLGK